MTLRAELQDSARKALAGAIAPDAEQTWRTIADLGWFGVEAPESLGGLGLGPEAGAAVHVEIGRALGASPAAHLMAIGALAQAEALPGRQALLDRAMAGERFTASLTFDGLGGPVGAVPDADKAAYLLAFTRDADRCVLLPLAGATCAHRQTWDRTRRLFDVTPDAAAQPLTLAEGAAATALHDRLKSQLLLALAADSIGGADAVLALSIDYLKTRRQFDRPLAMFQALKHRCADLKAQLAAAEALLWARAGDAGASLADMGALKALATTVYRTVAEEAVQLHGGIGLTEEHPCHLFLKRAFLNSALAGDADALEAAAGREILQQAAQK